VLSIRRRVSDRSASEPPVKERGCPPELGERRTAEVFLERLGHADADREATFGELGGGACHLRR
jgi:hypothetical protein